MDWHPYFGTVVADVEAVGDFEEIESVAYIEVVGIGEAPSSCSVGIVEVVAAVVADAEPFAAVVELPFEHWLGELCCWTSQMGPVDVVDFD